MQRGAIAHAHRPVASKARPVLEHGLGEIALAVDAVERGEVERGRGRRDVEQEVEELFALLEVAEQAEGAEGVEGVAQPTAAASWC
jgi:hypothetical protein